MGPKKYGKEIFPEKGRNVSNWDQRKTYQSLHYGPGNEIKEIEVCKKCPKVELYFVPIFDPIVVKPCLDDAK